MKSYIGCKIIQAEPMDISTFNKQFGTDIKPVDDSFLSEEGYYARYQNKYDAWIPKIEFEEVYRELNNNELASLTK